MAINVQSTSGPETAEELKNKIISGLFNTLVSIPFSALATDATETELVSEKAGHNTLVSAKAVKFTTDAITSSLSSHTSNTSNPHAVTKSQIGLGSVPNTDFTADVASALGHIAIVTGNPHAVTKSEVGLGNVDNTSDLDKPVSLAQQGALDFKQDIIMEGPFVDGDKVKLDNIEPGAQVNTVTSVAGKVGDVTLSSSDVGLGNVDNVADADKPVSSATQTALNLKQNILAEGAFADGDKTKLDGIQAGAQVNTVTSVASKTGAVTLTSADVGLGNVDNTSDANKPVSTAQQTALNLKANLESPTFTGTVSGISASMVGLGNVTNESKATMFTDPTFTGTVSGITKGMVGLGSVDNTSDADKPISTATQTALNLKETIAGAKKQAIKMAIIFGG